MEHLNENFDENFLEHFSKIKYEENYDNIISDYKIPQNWKSLAETLKNSKITTENFLIYTVTWNIKGKIPTKEEIQMILPKLNNKKQFYHLYVISSQECMRSIFSSFFNSNKDEWLQMIKDVLGFSYVLLKSETLSAMNLTIFAHYSIYKQISEISSDYVKTGLGNVMGNKGGIGISFIFKRKSFLFVGCHLAAGHSSTDNRNKDFDRINNNLNFENKIPKSTNETISDLFDLSFILGDFNYRIDLEPQQAIELINQEDLANLFMFDQLKNEIEIENININNFVEGPINFNPTYKFLSSKENNDENNIYDLSIRTPGWTDRIFFKSKDDNLTLCDYFSINTTYTSDHKPVYAVFKYEFLNEDIKLNKNKNFNDKNLDEKSQVCILF